MFEFKVHSVRFFTSDIFEIALVRGDYDFEPGHCAVLFDDHGNSRPYSIASGVEEPVLKFLLRRFTGGVLSNWLAERNPGDRVCVSLPFGSFRTASAAGPVVFVATGVGISPFLSALRSDGFGAESVHCLYGVRRLEDAVPVSMPENRVELHLAVSREQISGSFHGRVTDLLPTFSFPEDASYYLCGCDAMIDEVYDLLCARGVSSWEIHTEVFFNSEDRGVLTA